MDVQWIKLSTDIFNNRKIRLIESMPDGAALIVIWLKLLILASDVNDGGYVYFTKEIPYTDQLLATQFNTPLSTVQLALNTFRRFGMIETIDDVIFVSNWEKYQNSEALDHIREQNRLRKQRQREREKANLLECHAEKRDNSVTVTECHAIDKKKKVDIEEDKIKERGINAPTREDVQAFVRDNGLRMDANAFYDNYAAVGWVDGNGNKITDWKAKCRKWARDEIKHPKKESIYSSDASYDLAAFAKHAIGFRDVEKEDYQ